QAVVSQIRAAKISDAATDLPSAFDRARQALTEIEVSTRSRQMLLVTDFSYSSIHDPKRGGTGCEGRIEGADGDKLKKAAQGAISHLSSPTDFHMIDMGAEGQTNVAVTGLRSKRPLVVAGTPADFEIEVFNGSDKALLDEEVTIAVDG